MSSKSSQDRLELLPPLRRKERLPPPRDEKYLNDYLVHKEPLGRGTFGVVKLAETSGEKVAVKIFRIQKLLSKREYKRDGKTGRPIVKTALDSVFLELDALEKLRDDASGEASGRIVHLREAMRCPEKDKLYFVLTPYCPFGSSMEDREHEDYEFFIPARERRGRRGGRREWSKPVRLGIGVVGTDCANNILFYPDQLRTGAEFLCRT